MSEEPLFDPSLKKRKKKQVAFTEDPLGADADPTTPGPTVIDNVATNGETVDMGPKTVHEQMAHDGQGADGDEKKEDEDFKAMFGDLKKKKKKKDIPLDLPEEASGTSTPAVAADELDFSDLKKKKKSSKKKAAFDMEAFEKELSVAKAKGGEDEEEGGEDTYPLEERDDDLGDDPFARGESVSLEVGSEPWLASDRDYTYPELLRRFYAQLHASNPALLNATGKRYTIAPPQLAREGNKKTIFANISDICKRMHRQPEHVIQYMFAEMGTTGSVDGSGRLVIRGRFVQKQVEQVLRHYMAEYVICKTCKSPDTLLTKENRIFFVACESCGSRRSVSAVKTGFQAQVGKRSKNKTG